MYVAIKAGDSMQRIMTASNVLRQVDQSTLLTSQSPIFLPAVGNSHLDMIVINSQLIHFIHLYCQPHAQVQKYARKKGPPPTVISLFSTIPCSNASKPLRFMDRTATQNTHLPGL